MSVERNPDTDSQEAPVVNDRPYIQDMVIADIETRKQFGIAKYGTALQAGNGRDMLLDAYEEALDLVIYLRGALEERAIAPSRESSTEQQLPPGWWRAATGWGLVQRDTVFAPDLPDDAPSLTPLEPGWEAEAGVPQVTTNPYYRDPLPVWDRVKKWLRR